MTIALMVIPNFLIILFGWLLRHKLHYEASFFSRLEKFGYYILFPALLFKSLATTELSLTEAKDLILALLLLLGCVAGLALFAKLFRPNKVDFASSFQCAFRFNSYLALALSDSLLPSQGTAIMAILMGVSIPVVNVLSVVALSRLGQTQIIKELIRNPLIIGTLLGLSVNFSGLPLPELLYVFLGQISQAALPLGLICVGAGLVLKGQSQGLGLVSAFAVIKLIAMPIIAWVLAHSMNLSTEHSLMLIVYATLPTAPACYVLAVRMNGNGALVALQVSLQTVLSMLTIASLISLLT